MPALGRLRGFPLWFLAHCSRFPAPSRTQFGDRCASSTAATRDEARAGCVSELTHASVVLDGGQHTVGPGEVLGVFALTGEERPTATLELVGGQVVLLDALAATGTTMIVVLLNS
jgi:hypothetical protein